MQMRHPLALAHVANHPAANTQPNVMVASFSLAQYPGEHTSCQLLFAVCVYSIHVPGMSEGIA